MSSTETIAALSSAKLAGSPCCNSGCHATIESGATTPLAGHAADGNEKESVSPAICERGCLLVNGICPISEEEWRQALERRTMKEEAERQTRTAETPTPVSDAGINERYKWQQRAVFLSLLTIVYCIAEGTLSVVLGANNVSISLLALGADSWIEVVSACFVCWRFYSELRHVGDAAITKQTATQKERLATFTIGVLLCLLCAAIIAGSIAALVTHEQPESDLPNIIVGAAGAALLSCLYVMKLRVAIALKSSTVEADAQCSLFCVWLSLVLLVGAIVFKEAPSVWWFDSATAIVLALMIAKEGYETVTASMKKDFTGGGCGCEGEQDGLVMRLMRQRIDASRSPEETLCASIKVCQSGKKESCCANDGACCDEKGAPGKNDACCSKDSPACDKKDDCCNKEAPRPAQQESCCGDTASSCAAPCSVNPSGCSTGVKSDACCSKDEAQASAHREARLAMGEAET